MKRTITLAVLAVATAALTLTVRSQAPAPAQTPLQMLQTLKTQNQKVLDQQSATLQKLDELQKEAQQLRILARRT
ncbi:hypothetical protein ACXR0O_16600 [Verrucomicrobiota bacterium sgz303538]